MNNETERYLGAGNDTAATTWEPPPFIPQVLVVFGGILHLIGFLAFLYLINMSGQAGLFSSKGEITGSEALLAAAVWFYNAVLGTVCIGIAKVLREISVRVNIGSPCADASSTHTRDLSELSKSLIPHDSD